VSGEDRRKLVHRLDIVFFIGLLVTSGLAAVLFWSQFDTDDEADAVSEKPSATQTDLPTETETATPIATLTLPPTLTRTSTITPSATQTRTSTATATPWPAPVVSPLALAEMYAGEPLLIMGTAQPGDTIQLFDQDELIIAVTAGDDGAWSIDLTNGLPAGTHNLAVVAVGPGGVTSDPVAIGFDVANPPTETPTPTSTATHTPTNTLTPTPTATHTKTPRPPTAVSATEVLVVPSETTAPSLTPVPPSVTVTVLLPPTETQEPTRTPTSMAAPTETLAQTDTPHPPTLTPTVELPAIPQLDALPSEMSILDPVVITGAGEAGQTISLSTNGTAIGETAVQADGTWSLAWQTDLLGAVEISAAVTTDEGLVSDPAVGETELVAPRPEINSPASGDVFSPGVAIPVNGTAQPGTTVEIRNEGAGTVIATAPVTASGRWETTIVLYGAGKVTISAAAVGAANSSDPSDPVTITLAPPVHPDTGGSADSHKAGQTFTVLLALLLAAGGFSMYFAGRLVYTLAQDRLKPH